MSRRLIRYAAIGSVTLGLGIAGTLVASAQWSIPGQGAVQVTAAAMPAGDAPKARRAGTSIVVSWDSEQIAPGVEVQKYLVTAHDTQAPARPDVTRTVPATAASTETATFPAVELGEGKWSWGIVAKYQLWSGVEGPRSTPAVVIGRGQPTGLLAAPAPTAAGDPPTAPTGPAPATVAAPETTTEKPSAEPTTPAPEKTVEPAETNGPPTDTGHPTIDPSPAGSAFSTGATRTD
jgi:hypothetical protein